MSAESRITKGQLASINPATGETLKTYPTITDGELEAAISGAYKTYQE